MWPSARTLSAWATCSGLACPVVCSFLLYVDVGSTIKPSSSSRGYLRHHLASIVLTEMRINAFSHAIFIQRAGDSLVHSDGGMLAGCHRVGDKWNSDALLVSLFDCQLCNMHALNSCVNNGIVLRGNEWQSYIVPRNFYHSVFCEHRVTCFSLTHPASPSDGWIPSVPSGWQVTQQSPHSPHWRKHAVSAQHHVQHIPQK